MCRFIEEMERLKSSSSDSVANEEFSEFNEYMHTESSMDEHLSNVIKLANEHNKALVLVCGNSGDGKSHLIARLKSKGVYSDSDFNVYIDATSADKKGMKANEKLKEKLLPFSDERINNNEESRLIVAINLGILNDFLKNYEHQFSVLKSYVDSQGLFDIIPAWKYELTKDQYECETYFIGHVDFTSYHRYCITSDGLDLSFINGLFEKIVSDDPRNTMRKTFDECCESCKQRSNCPVYCNYKRISENKSYREFVVKALSKAIITHNIAPSVRDINNFFYEIIIGRTFDESLIMDNSIQRLTHYVNNLSLSLLFGGTDGLLALISEQDVLNDKNRSCDKDLISLNLKPSFEKWLKEDAIRLSDEFKQIEADIKYCQGKHAKNYRDEERTIKRSIFQYYLRLSDLAKDNTDTEYSSFIRYLYEYNIGNEKGCKDLINLIKDGAYVWNGRLGDSSGENIKNAVIIGKGTEKYYLYKILNIEFRLNTGVKSLPSDGEYSNFSSTLRFNFGLKDKKKVIPLNVDYELFELLNAIKNGYIPTENDRKKNVNFDSFVRTLIAETESDLYVYARYDEGKTYRLRKDEFESYTFEKEG